MPTSATAASVRSPFLAQKSPPTLAFPLSLFSPLQGLGTCHVNPEMTLTSPALPVSGPAAATRGRAALLHAWPRVSSGRVCVQSSTGVYAGLSATVFSLQDSLCLNLTQKANT